jgi:hypothetical protein
MLRPRHSSQIIATQQKIEAEDLKDTNEKLSMAHHWL